MSKVWFVTGSNSGIGLGIAKSALAGGDCVVATGRNMEKLRAAFADVSPDDLELIPLDVTEATQAQNAVREPSSALDASTYLSTMRDIAFWEISRKSQSRICRASSRRISMVW